MELKEISLGENNSRKTLPVGGLEDDLVVVFLLPGDGLQQLLQESPELLVLVLFRVLLTDLQRLPKLCPRVVLLGELVGGVRDKHRISLAGNPPGGTYTNSRTALLESYEPFPRAAPAFSTVFMYASRMS